MGQNMGLLRKNQGTDQMDPNNDLDMHQNDPWVEGAEATKKKNNFNCEVKTSDSISNEGIESFRCGRTI